MEQQTIRLAKILELAQRNGRVEVEALTRRFGVSAQTIRTDLKNLVKRNSLQRIHGGAILPTNTYNFKYQERRRIATEGKVMIGRMLSTIIPDQVSLILNIGTTTEQVAFALNQHHGLMVITNNLNVANILSEAEDIELVVAGGMVRKVDGGIVGEAAVDLIRQFKVDYAIIGVSAIDNDGTLLDFDYREVRVAQAILGQARKRILVADETKFNRRAPVQIGNLTDIDIFVTDNNPPPEIIEYCKNNGVRCIVASHHLQKDDFHADESPLYKPVS